MQGNKRTDNMNKGNKNIKLNTSEVFISEFNENWHVKNVLYFFPRRTSISLLLLPKTLFSFEQILIYNLLTRHLELSMISSLIS